MGLSTSQEETKDLLHVQPRQPALGNEWVWDGSRCKGVDCVGEERRCADVPVVDTSNDGNCGLAELRRTIVNDDWSMMIVGRNKMMILGCRWMSMIVGMPRRTNPSRTESFPIGRRPRKKAGDCQRLKHYKRQWPQRSKITLVLSIISFQG